MSVFSRATFGSAWVCEDKNAPPKQRCAKVNAPRPGEKAYVNAGMCYNSPECRPDEAVPDEREEAPDWFTDDMAETIYNAASAQHHGTLSAAAKEAAERVLLDIRDRVHKPGGAFIGARDHVSVHDSADSDSESTAPTVGSAADEQGILQDFRGVSRLGVTFDEQNELPHASPIRGNRQQLKFKGSEDGQRLKSKGSEDERVKQLAEAVEKLKQGMETRDASTEMQFKIIMTAISNLSKETDKIDATTSENLVVSHKTHAGVDALRENTRINMFDALTNWQQFAYMRTIGNDVKHAYKISRSDMPEAFKLGVIAMVRSGIFTLLMFQHVKWCVMIGLVRQVDVSVKGGLYLAVLAAFGYHIYNATVPLYQGWKVGTAGEIMSQMSTMERVVKHTEFYAMFGAEKVLIPVSESYARAISDGDPTLVELDAYRQMYWIPIYAQLMSYWATVCSTYYWLAPSKMLDWEERSAGKAYAAEREKRAVYLVTESKKAKDVYKHNNRVEREMYERMTKGTVAENEKIAKRTEKLKIEKKDELTKTVDALLRDCGVDPEDMSVAQCEAYNQAIQESRQRLVDAALVTKYTPDPIVTVLQTYGAMAMVTCILVMSNIKRKFQSAPDAAEVPLHDAGPLPPLPDVRIPSNADHKTREQKLNEYRDAESLREKYRLQIDEGRRLARELKKHEIAGEQIDNPDDLL